jgi:DNA-binding PadR family transcriptional regulator
MSSEPDSFLPLSPPVFHILLALADRERHGYAIIKEIERRTAESIVLSTGTLYAAIKRLLGDGLIESAEGRGADPELDDARRRYYQLTVMGKLVVRAETGRLAELLAMSHDKQLSPFFSGGGTG